MTAANSERSSAPICYIYYRAIGSHRTPQGLYCTVQIPTLRHKTRFNLTDFFKEKFTEAPRLPYSSGPATMWEAERRGPLSEHRVGAIILTAPEQLTVQRQGHDYAPLETELEAWFNRTVSYLRLPAAERKQLWWEYIKENASKK